jgi:fumarate reductase subunit D
MIRATHRRPGYIAAILHRLSGIALAIFLPMHFIALGTALSGANPLDDFLALTHNRVALIGEWGIVTALSLHMMLGLRVLAIEWLALADRTAALVSSCAAGAFAVGALFLLSAV